MKRNFSLTVKILSNCVLPGVLDDFASPARCVSMLISVDLPTFDLPIIANSGNPGSGNIAISATLVTNFAS